jgi:phosphatidylglycerophosphatase C
LSIFIFARQKACETKSMDQPLAPTVAAFDLDGTLTEGGSVFKWLGHLSGSRRLYQKVLPLAGPLLVGAVRSGASADRAKERLFRSLLAGKDLEEVRELSRQFALEHLAREGRPQLLARLNWHLEQKHDVVIVSASPQIYVEDVAQALEAQGAVGTRLAVDPLGKLTGGYLGKNCRGAEKLRRLNEWIDERDFTVEPVIYAYGNSRGDKRLLSGATHPYNAGHLGLLGSLRSFPRLTRE